MQRKLCKLGGKIATGLGRQQELLLFQNSRNAGDKRPQLESCLHNLLWDLWDVINLLEPQFTPLGNERIKPTS